MCISLLHNTCDKLIDQMIDEMVLKFSQIC